MIIAVVIILVILLLLFLYSACKISGDLSREEEYQIYKKNQEK